MLDTIAVLSLIRENQAAFVCGHCNAFALHNKVVDRATYPHKYELNSSQGLVQIDTQRQQFIVRCAHCGKHSYVLIEFVPPQSVLVPDTLQTRAIHRHPCEQSFPMYAGVPTDVMDAAIEAEKCSSVAAYNASGVMARRAMHALCKDKGASGRDLFEQLKDLKDRHVITPDLWEWSEELRALGRNGAHPEWPEVNAEDAEYGLKFLREIIKFVYVHPHDRAQRRLKETSTKTV